MFLAQFVETGGLRFIEVQLTGKKDLVKLLRLLENSGYPHIVINSKGRVLFPDRRFHGAVVVTDLNKE